MTAVTLPQPDLTSGRGAAAQFAADVWVLTKRSISRIRNEPETLSNVTIQPVMFVLMFTYVFGGAIGLSGAGGSYHSYLIGGMIGMSLAQTAPGTAVAVVSDMSTGLIDRFRSLPMSRAAVLTARTIADLITNAIGVAVVAVVGLAIGWRITTNAGDAIEAFALALLFGYAFTWAGVCLGMVLRSPEAAQQVGHLGVGVRHGGVVVLGRGQREEGPALEVVGEEHGLQAVGHQLGPVTVGEEPAQGAGVVHAVAPERRVLGDGGAEDAGAHRRHADAARAPVGP